MPQFLDGLLAPLRRMGGSPMKSLGRGGTAIYGGYIQENEKDASVSGPQKYVTYSEILANVSIVAASVRHFLNLTARAGWKLEPAKVKGEQVRRAEEIAELVDSMLYDMSTPWACVVRRAAMFKFHGFSMQEWTAKRREDGLVGMLDVEARPQVTITRWDVDVSGTVHGVIQTSPQTGEDIYLPRKKLVYCVDDALRDSPEGLGIFRHLAEPAKRLRRFQLLEAWGYETDLRGIPVGRAPLAMLDEMVESGQLSAEQRTAALQPLDTLIREHTRRPDMGLLLDSLTYQTTDERQSPSSVYQWALEVLRGDAALSSEAVMKAIDRLQREMARIMGTEFLLLGDGTKGSFSLSKDKTNQFALQVDSTLTEIAETFESDFVRPLFRLNGWPMELLPTLKPDATRFQDVEQITGALESLARAGSPVIPNDPAVAEVYDILGLTSPPTMDMDVDAAVASPIPEPQQETPEGELPGDKESDAEEEMTT